MCDEKTKKMSFFFACSTQIQHKNSFVQFAIDMKNLETIAASRFFVVEISGIEPLTS